MIKHMQRLAREEQILTTLDKLGVATRAHLQRTNDLGGNRNANRVLSQMENDKAIKSIRMDQKIYYAPHKELKQSEKGQIIHMLMRNDMFLYYNQPKSWEIEAPIDFDYKGEPTILRSDATFMKQGEYHFLEVDNTQRMNVNKDKIDKYKVLSNLIFKSYNHTPTLIWYTVSKRRKEHLRSMCEQKGVKSVVLSLSDI